MKVLVSNDDGVDAPGLAALARAVEAAGHEVVVVAPDTDWSGAGAAVGTIGENERIVLEGRTIPGLRGDVWSVSGPPARGALAVLRGGLDWFPDAIASGVNPGANMGRSVIHSGTVGVVLAGANHGVRGVAISARVANDLERAAAYVGPALTWLDRQPQPRHLNINVPELGDVPPPASWALLASRGLNDRAVHVPGEDPDTHVVELRRTPFVPDDETDYGLVAAGHVAITSLEPLRGTTADHDLAEALAEVGR